MNSTHRPVQPEEDGADLAALFTTAMADLETRPEAMAGMALRQGRPRRRRRIVAAAAAGTLALGLVGGLGAYGLNGLSAAPRPTVDPAATGAAGPTTGGTPTPAVQPTAAAPTSAATTAAPPASDGWLTPRVAALYLKRLAPSGTLSDFQGDEWRSDKQGEERAGSVTVRAQLDRGEGDVGLGVSLQGAYVESIGGQESDIASSYSCSALGGPGIADCTVSRRDDGSVLMTYTEALPLGSTSSSVRGRAVVADFLRTDGTRVLVTTGNVPNLSEGGIPRRGSRSRRRAGSRRTRCGTCSGSRRRTTWRRLNGRSTPGGGRRARTGTRRSSPAPRTSRRSRTREPPRCRCAPRSQRST